MSGLGTVVGYLKWLALVSAVVTASCRGDREPELLFKVALGRLPRGIQREYPSLGPRDSAELRLPGEWFETPRQMRVIPRERADLSTPLAAAEAAYSAFKQEDDDGIVASFAEADREDIRGFLADPAVRAGSRDYYRSVRSQELVGWAAVTRDSTQYRLVFVTLQTTAAVKRLETYVLEQGAWLRTNGLSRDPTFQFAWNAFRFGRITRQ